MAAAQNRQPAGRPIGGQYATTEHSEAAVTLTPAPALPEGWPASLPAPDRTLDLEDPAAPTTVVHTGDAKLQVSADGRMVSYDFTPSEADFDDIQAAIDWARAEHEKATRPGVLLRELAAREASLVDQRAMTAARTLSHWASQWGYDTKIALAPDPDDPDHMTVTRIWTDRWEADPEEIREALGFDGDYDCGRDLCRLLPMQDSGWFDQVETVVPGGEFPETQFVLKAGDRYGRTRIDQLSHQIDLTREAQALAAVDFIAEDAARGFGDGTQVHFGASEMGHMVAIAVIRPDGSRVSDSEFEQWYGAAPNGDDPYLPDLCRHLPEQDSAWFDRAEAIDVSEWETVFAVRVGGSR